MTKRKLAILVLALSAVSFISGGATVKYYPEIKGRLTRNINPRISTGSSSWPAEFSVVRIKSATDGSFQAAYFWSSRSGNKKPLVVSLHTWSGDYSQNDPLAAMAKNAGWNYIHPDFRGSNSTKDACLGEKVVSDIDDAIQYAIENSPVDGENIFMVGASGGGYVTLGSYLKTRHNIRAFLAWAPISDLVSWFHQSMGRNDKYANDILACTSAGDILDENEAKRRSPLFMDFPAEAKGSLEIYAGIDDGFEGGVPISHAILFFNRAAMQFGNTEALIGQDEIANLLTLGIARGRGEEKIGGREVLYSKMTDGLTLKIFDGGHEMLPEYTFERMKQISEQGVAGKHGIIHK